jgi:hypothetical protein
VRHRQPNELEGRRDVEVERALEVSHRRVEQRARHRSARVVHEDVDAAEFVDRALHERGEETEAPACAKSSAMAAPIPLPPPVTIAT